MDLRINRYCNKVLPLVYDESLSYYELLCKIIDKVNELAEDTLGLIKYADPIQWNITKQYSENTVVVDPETGTAYISRQPVPSGILLTDKNYWNTIFNYAGLIPTITYIEQEKRIVVTNFNAVYGDASHSYDGKTNSLVIEEEV